MKISIDVEAVMEKCTACPRLELETIRTPYREDVHRCKHLTVCRSVIAVWEAEHGKV